MTPANSVKKKLELKYDPEAFLRQSFSTGQNNRKI